MWAHEDIAGVQVSLQKVLLGFADVDASERSLWEGVGWDKRKAVQANLVDTVDGLQRKPNNVTWSVGSSRLYETHIV